MNEQPNTTVQLEKTLDDKKKNALLRYLGIMFAVAFLFYVPSIWENSYQSVSVGLGILKSGSS
jgi:hypothetical protein